MKDVNEFVILKATSKEILKETRLDRINRKRELQTKCPDIEKIM